jgi:serine/threonine protein phosphatase PrpC
MEDRTLSIDLSGHPAFPGTGRAGLFAVFDGHGGEAAAEWLQHNMLPLIIQQGAAALRDEPAQALTRAIGAAEHALVSAWKRGSGHAAGSTLCLALVVDSNAYVAHVGDSRAVLGTANRAVALTADHKASSSREAQRILAADPSAAITSDGYLYGELGISRGLGSAHIKTESLKRAYVATPEVKSIELGESDDFLLLATDGLWDQVSSADAVAAARRSMAESRDPAAAAQALVERAQKLGSLDNTSVVVVLLHDRAIVLPKSNSRLFAKRAVQAAVSEAAAAASEVVYSPSISPGGAQDAV